MKLINLLSLLIFSFSLSVSLSAQAETLEQAFDEALNGKYKFQDSVCQNEYPEDSEEYNSFKLKIDGHGYKMTKNQLIIKDGIATHETIIKSGLFGTCVVRGAGEITPETIESIGPTTSGVAIFNIDTPKKYNKKTGMGCKCSPLPAVCQIMIPYVKQDTHKVYYEVRETDDQKTIRFTQKLNFVDSKKTIESEENFHSKYRQLCGKHRDSDAPPTNIFKAL